VIALVPVRVGTLPAGGVETVEEAGGRAVVAGEGTEEAVRELVARLGGGLRHVERAEVGQFAPARWACQLAPGLEPHDVVILPSAPDGRDLAPRLAAALGRPLLAAASRVCAKRATLVRRAGAQHVDVEVEGPFVATLLTPHRRGRSVSMDPEGSANHGTPHGRGGDGGGGHAAATAESMPSLASRGDDEWPVDAVSAGLLEPDPSVVDLTEAERIVAGGAGLGAAEEFASLFRLGDLLAAAVGGTRVVTDAGIIGHDRQIGTTGVSVWPRLYLAFGISGAAQHVGGLGEPEHVISVNLDASCPMMAMADLAIVADARATLDALVTTLAERQATTAPVEGAAGG
jgi:electron transfer flavoprotein alpha subunit